MEKRVLHTRNVSKDDVFTPDAMKTHIRTSL